MKNKFLFFIVVNLFTAPLAFAGGGHDHGGHDHGHEHSHDEHEAEPAKGPHGGKLLEKDDFAIEITIFEKGVPPEYRVYAYHDEKPVQPTEFEVKIQLTRFGDKKEDFSFVPEGEYLSSEKEVKEPHSFDVSVNAKFQGTDYHWKYSSHEGRTELTKSARRVADIEISEAGPAVISNSIRVYGRLLANEDRVAHIVPRFSGVLKEIRKTLGDTVEKGEVVAIVESNQSLQPYEIKSQVSGSVVSRHATLGEYVPDTREIMVIADLSEVWADFQVFRDDIGSIKVGQSISIDLGDSKELAATVTYVSPLTDDVTQSKLVRAVLPNPTGSLRPGLFITGNLTTELAEVPIAVKREAIQSFRDWDVVYLTDGHVFQAMPVTLGRKDADSVEILSGIEAGVRYVSRNSFIIKADIEKAGASHDH